MLETHAMSLLSRQPEGSRQGNNPWCLSQESCAFCLKVIPGFADSKFQRMIVSQ